MNGYTQGAITGGIGEGLQQASANILNLYGMQRHFDMQQQNLDIQNKNAATYQKRVDLKNFGSDKWWDDATLDRFHQPSETPGQPRMTGPPQALRLGAGIQPMTGDSRYLRPDANSFRR